jgi:mannose-1-phosphate guanylyltransferase/mannose-6-phosphate isomerase
MSKFIPAIMSGGSGTRLWPVSRQSFPKQFSELFGPGLENSLFAKATKRLMPLGSPWTITVQDMNVLTEKTLKTCHVSPAEIAAQTLYEPRGRNTAAAVAFFCRVLELRGQSDAIGGVFPADQLIRDEVKFQNAVREAVLFAEKGEVVTLGISPTFPATGYGYIETAGLAAAGPASKALRATRFREKPDLKTATEFLAKGGYLWNAGMFVFKVSKMIELLKQHAPKVWAPFESLKPDFSNLKEVYDQVEVISIDFAVMERLSSHVTIPCDFDWSDVGSWDAIAAISGGQASIEVAAKNCFVLPYGDKSYAFVGTDDLIVVDTQDALLVAKRGESEKVKDVVDRLKTQSHGLRATNHGFEVRPWGKFEILRDTEEFKSKTITVDAGAQLSLQSHTKRAEHWIIVRGRGEVVLNNEVIPVTAGSHVFIPIGAKHRMRNTEAAGAGKELVFVEIQLGTYFGEDDITRYEDNYGRK